MKKIESYEYLLKYDRIIPGAVETLQKLNSGSYRLVLVTLRNSISTLEKELALFQIKDLFSLILSPSGGISEENRKAMLIRKDAAFQKDYSLIIGDTEEDILAGKLLGITSVGVLSGIRTKDYLASYSPDFLISSIPEIWSVLKKGS